MSGWRGFWRTFKIGWTGKVPTPEPVYDCELILHESETRSRTIRAREEPRGVLTSEPFPCMLYVARAEVPIVVLAQAFFNGRKVDLKMDPVGRPVNLTFCRGDTLQIDLRLVIGDS